MRYLFSEKNKLGLYVSHYIINNFILKKNQFQKVIPIIHLARAQLKFKL